MKIGLYGMPTSGKTYILEKIDFMEVIAGSTLLRQHDPLFDERDEQGRDKTRSEIATLLMEKESFIMDGHYAFGDEIAFTEQDGKLYDAFIYLYINPSILKERMMRSSKNRKYASYDIEKWQLNEINELRAYCHKHNKDFYVIDHPTKNTNVDSEIVVQFIYDIFKGFSCHNLAERIALKFLVLQKVIQSPCLMETKH